MTKVDWRETLHNHADGARSESSGVSRDGAAPVDTSLIEEMTVALWQVDARAPGAVFSQLRDIGVSDIGAYLLDHPDLIDLAASSVNVLHVNRAAMELTGAASRSQLMASVDPIFAGNREAAERLMCARFGGSLCHLDQFTLRRFDGSTVEVLFLVIYPSPLDPPDKTFLIALDVTERRHPGGKGHGIDENDDMGELVSMLVHEIRQPLGAISTYAQALIRWLDRPDFDKQRAQEILGRIVESTEIANNIVAKIQARGVGETQSLSLAEANEAIRVALKLLSDSIGLEIR